MATDEANHETGEPDEAVNARSAAGPQWVSFLRNTLLILVLVGLVWLAFNVRLPSISELRSLLDGLGWGAWLAFIGLYAVVAITPIPVSVMAVTAGVLFGVIEGSVLSVVGVLLGCWAAFWLARAVGSSVVERLLGHHGPTVRNHLNNDGFQAVYLLRLMPGLPYWPVNYGSGAFGVSQRDYVVASCISVVPGQVSLVAVGALVADPTVWRAIVVVVAWVIVVIMTVWAYRGLKGTSKRPLPGMGFR